MQTQSQSQEGSSVTLRSLQPSKGKSRAAVIAIDSDGDFGDEAEVASVKGRSRTTSRGTTPAFDAAPESTRASRRTQSSAQTRGKKNQQPLFLDEGDDDDIPDSMDAVIPEEADEEVIPATRLSRRAGAAKTTKATSTKSKARARVADDDSDDGVAFRGFGSRRK